MSSENPDVRSGWFACALFLAFFAWLCFSLAHLAQYPEVMGDASYHEVRTEAELLPK